MSDVTVQDIFKRFLPAYEEKYKLSNRQRLTAYCIKNCRTSDMGANVTECESCGVIYVHYNSCKNRHCPMCHMYHISKKYDM